MTNRVIVYDKNDKSAAGRFWPPGAWLFARLQGARVVAVENVDHMLARLASMSDLRGAQVEVWCHAAPASFVLGAQRFNMRTVRDDERVALLGTKLSAEGTFWIRGCSPFAGPVGHAFAGTLADTLGCRAAGHTHMIGLLQGGLRTIKPRQQPLWSPEEGEAGGRPGAARTTWKTPRTITALHWHIPEEWSDGE